MDLTDILELIFATLLVLSVIFILAQCMFTHQTIYDIFKSQLAVNGSA